MKVHLRVKTKTGARMRQIIYACIPGIAVISASYGPRVLLHVLICALLGHVLDRLCLYARASTPLPSCFSRLRYFIQWGDGSAALSGVLVGLLLPVQSPLWLGLLAMPIAVIVSKQLYGGLGHNPFNPMMSAYVALYLLFPTLMASSTQTTLPIAAAFAAGGLYLTWRRYIAASISVSLLLTLLALSSLSYVLQPSTAITPWQAIFNTPTLFIALFIATDSVTAATRSLGRIIYGVSIAGLVFLLSHDGHHWGLTSAYSSASYACAILLMNSLVPALDRLLQARCYAPHLRATNTRGTLLARSQAVLSQKSVAFAVSCAVVIALIYGLLLLILSDALLPANHRALNGTWPLFTMLPLLLMLIGTGLAAHRAWLAHRQRHVSLSNDSTTLANRATSNVVGSKRVRTTGLIR